MARNEITVIFQGKSATGIYRVEKGVITVTDGLNEKSTQVGGSPPEVIAKRLLTEILIAQSSNT